MLTFLSVPSFFLFCKYSLSQNYAQKKRKKNTDKCRENLFYRIPKSTISSNRIVCRARVRSAFISFSECGR